MFVSSVGLNDCLCSAIESLLKHTRLSVYDRCCFLCVHMWPCVSLCAFAYVCDNVSVRISPGQTLRPFFFFYHNDLMVSHGCHIDAV